jgi:hypothetical protein
MLSALASSENAVSDKENQNPVVAMQREKKKRLMPGQRVSGNVEPLIANPDINKKRQVRKRLYGNVIEEAGNKKYKVQFDDSKVHECHANTLHMEKLSASLPPDERPPPLLASAATMDVATEADPDNQEEDDEAGDPQKEGDEEEEGWGAPMEDESQEQLVVPRMLANVGQATGDGAAEGNATGGIFFSEDMPLNYHQRLAEARAKITALEGKAVTRDSWTWTVVPEHHVDDAPEQRFLGVTGIDLHRLEKPVLFASLFLHLTFHDWKESHKKNE